MHGPIAEQDLFHRNRMWSNKAKQWSLLIAVLMLLCSITIRWVQCALIFLTDSFSTSDLISKACLTFIHHSFHCIPRHARQQCLSKCPSNSCHMIVCAAYIIANISKPTRRSKPAQLENCVDKPLPHSDSYSIHNVTEQSEYSPMQLAIDMLHFNPPCS